MYIDTKRSNYKKHRTILNVDDHLSARLAANSNPALLGMKKASSRGSECSQIRSKNISNLCCVVHALNIISIWETKKDLLD